MTSPSAGSDLKTQILQATDIVELIGQTVALKRRGKNFVGLCPFHQEKTGSFNVSPQRQFFHCFGCKASGNAIDFVMKRDRLEFVDAMRTLAERAGIAWVRRGADSEKAGERQQLFEAHSAACGLFENFFSHPQSGAAARQYLEQRGFSPQTLKQFRVGVAPDLWDAMLKSPAMRRFAPELLALGGLIKPRDNGGGFYDTFRARIIFPIMEESQARVIAFGGRVMPGTDNPAKYLNSPETPLFSKSRVMFGLNFARQRMLETGVAIIMEGYTDVMMAHQFGVSNAVSIMGTALTEQHIKALKRFDVGKVVFLFDGDEAGHRAVDRSIELLLTQEMDFAVGQLPQEMDPDEYLLAHGKDAFERQVIAEARDVLSYKWAQLDRLYADSAGNLTAQNKAVESYLDLISRAREAGPIDPMRWGAIVARVSRLTGMPMDEIHRRFTRRRAVPAAEGVQAGQPVASPEKRKTTAQELAERQLLGILLREPHRWHQVKFDVHPEELTNPAHRRLAELYWQHQQDIGEPQFAEFLSDLSESSVKELAVELMQEAEELEQLEQTLSGAMAFLQEERERRKAQKQKADMLRINQQGISPEEQAAQWAEFVKNNQSADPRRLGPIRRLK